MSNNPVAAPAALAAGLLTIAEAADRLGVSVSRVRGYVAAGRLQRANPRMPGEPANKPALYRPVDVDACRAYSRAEWLAKWERYRERIEAAGERRCTLCNATKPLGAFQADPKGPAGRNARCADCSNALAREARRADPERHRAIQARYNARHRERLLALRREWCRKNRAACTARKRAWREKRVAAGLPAEPPRPARRRRGGARDGSPVYNRLHTALCFGASSPVHRLPHVGGFALVTRAVGGWDFFRAARLDQRFLPGEVPAAVVEWSPARAAWLCSEPRVGRDARTARVAARCHELLAARAAAAPAAPVGAERRAPRA